MSSIIFFPKEGANISKYNDVENENNLIGSKLWRKESYRQVMSPSSESREIEEEDDNLASEILALPDFEAELRNTLSNKVDTQGDENCRNSIVLTGERDKSAVQQITENIMHSGTATSDDFFEQVIGSTDADVLRFQ